MGYCNLEEGQAVASNRWKCLPSVGSLRALSCVGKKLKQTTLDLFNWSKYVFGKIHFDKICFKAA